MSLKIILHIDMDAFFAAVEQRDHPEYRGKPVIVGADPRGGKGRGVVSTCSYEARKFGIHSAMPISRAYKLCPFAIYLPGRMKVYKQVSKALMGILNNYSSLVEPLSIDEAFLDITGSIRLFGSPVNIANKIKNQIVNDLHLTASIGIAPNKFLAKIASDLEKPDGLVIVNPARVKEFLSPLPISKLWGVGKKTQPIFIKYGIRTIGDLANHPREKIVKKFGKSGLHFWNLANGIDDREVIHDVGQKSISQETTFDEDTCDQTKIKKTLYYLCTDLARLLRKDGYKGKTITLKIRLQDFSTYTRSHSIVEHTNSSETIYGIIHQLYHKFDCADKKIRLLGVSISNLDTHQNRQISIFNNTEDERTRADKVMDLVQNKFGVNAIQKASILNMNRRHKLTDQKVKTDESDPEKS